MGADSEDCRLTEPTSGIPLGPASPRSGVVEALQLGSRGVHDVGRGAHIGCRAGAAITTTTTTASFRIRMRHYADVPRLRRVGGQGGSALEVTCSVPTFEEGAVAVTVTVVVVVVVVAVVVRGGERGAKGAGGCGKTRSCSSGALLEACLRWLAARASLRGPDLASPRAAKPAR